MRDLAPRTYPPDGAWRRRWLVPDSVVHPAKMNAYLCRDLFLRYTLQGQTVLDPFGGIGTSLLGCALGRDVVLVELEPQFVALARANWEHLRRHTLPGVASGRARIEQGDSRHLPLPARRSRGGGGEPSAPFGAMNAPDCGGTIKARPRPDGRGFEGQRADYLYSEDTPGHIGNLPLGDVAAVISSQPYADVGLPQPERGAVRPSAPGAGDGLRHTRTQPARRRLRRAPRQHRQPGGGDVLRGHA